jgi:hypothetical protein
MSDQSTSLVPKPDQAVVRRFMELVKGIDRDDPSPADVQALREMLHDHSGLWREYGDLAQNAAATLIQRLEASPHVAESLICGWLAMKDDLGYSVAPPLEWHLIEEVVLCSMLNYLVAAGYSIAMTKPITQSSADPLGAPPLRRPAPLPARLRVPGPRPQTRPHHPRPPAQYRGPRRPAGKRGHRPIRERLMRSEGTSKT